MTMTRQGCEREPKFRDLKHTEGKVILSCPSTSNGSPSSGLSYSGDNLCDEITSEISVRKFINGLKKMENDESELNFKTVLSQRRPTLTNDPTLLSSLLKKNEALLKENTEYVGPKNLRTYIKLMLPYFCQQYIWLLREIFKHLNFFTYFNHHNFHHILFRTFFIQTTQLGRPS